MSIAHKTTEKDLERIVQAALVRKFYGLTGNGNTLEEISHHSGIPLPQVRELLKLTCGKGGWS